jgi:predicted anti-sigma-YlaC factor YlaD
MTCSECEASLGAYADGTMTEAAARALEAHAATCASCGAMLDALPRPALATFSPALPPALRDATLRAVASAPQPHIARRRWFVAAAGMAAAALFAIWSGALRPRTDGRPVVIAANDSAALTVDAATLAAARATTEFDAIDAAERELRDALAAAPTDRELQAFLEAVAAQRAALLQRVKDART